MVSVTPVHSQQPVEGLYHTGEPLYIEPPDYRVLENPSMAPHHLNQYSDSDMGHSDYSGRPIVPHDMTRSYDAPYTARQHRPPSMVNKDVNNTYASDSLPRTPRVERGNGSVQGGINNGGDHSSSAASQSSSGGGNKSRRHRRRRQQHRDMQSHAECSSNGMYMEIEN